MTSDELRARCSGVLALPEVPSPLAAAIRQAPLAGCFVEFGVASAWRGSRSGTLELLATSRYTVGFDTFEGLPEDWRPEYPRGSFSQNRIPLVANCTLVVGAFADVLPKVKLAVALCHIDCDLYSSTKAALAWLKDNAVRGCIVVFDEFFGYPGCEEHEARALAESGLLFEPLFRSPMNLEKLAVRLLP